MANSNFLKTIVAPPNADLDIVAVHGMNLENNERHADNTWTDRTTNVNWLKDLLPSRLPNARVLAYQYNANIAFGASSAGINEQAKNMLQCMLQDRRANGTRPIIFVTHSLGGLLVKEALAISFRRTSISHDLDIHSQHRLFRQDSATLGLPDGQEAKFYLNRTHKTICKFASAEEPEWKQVSDALYHMALSVVEPQETKEQSLSRQQAIQGARDVIWSMESGSPAADKLHRIHAEVQRHQDAAFVVVGWFMSIFALISSFLGWIQTLDSFLLPSKDTIMRKAEEARQSQVRVVELEQQAIQNLDSQRVAILQAANQLTPFLNEPSGSGSNIDMVHQPQIWSLQVDLDRAAA
ncbi:hypothetical protein TrVGV298_007397 [Trichoderma virens]|nr:hypothetical protein TrVGV298_007397 [Trichoderma virens]